MTDTRSAPLIDPQAHQPIRSFAPTPVTGRWTLGRGGRLRPRLMSVGLGEPLGVRKPEESEHDHPGRTAQGRQLRGLEFDGYPPKAGGALFHGVDRMVSDPSTLVVATGFRSVKDAENFLAKPELGEAMKKAGVIGQPRIEMYTEVESVTYESYPLRGSVLRGPSGPLNRCGRLRPAGQTLSARGSASHHGALLSRVPFVSLALARHGEGPRRAPHELRVRL